MPRDGSGIYTRPPGTDGIPDTTIESTKYNSFVGDVETDLNAARPVIAGGTGANNATAARDNLDAERAMQVVTNYDTHTWEAGSFYSSSATGQQAPINGHAFMGTVQVMDVNNITIQARDLDGPTSPGIVYVRHKRAGVWSAWTTEGSMQFVELTGDTMSGDLTISKSFPTIWLNRTTAAPEAGIYGQRLGSLRWGILPGFGDDAGGNAGSDFLIRRFNDAGAFNGTPLLIDRATGRTTLTGSVAPSLAVKLNGAGAVATFEDDKADGTAYIQINSQAGAAAFGTHGNYPAILNPGALGNYLMQFDTNNNLANLKSGLVIETGFASPGLLPSSSPGAGNATKGWTYRYNTTYGPEMYWNADSYGRIYMGQNVDGTLIYWTRSGVSVGSINITTTSTVYATSSDERLKDDLKSFDAGHIIDDTKVYDFAWKATGVRDYGVVAQQANAVYPAAVVYDEKADWWGIDYSKYVPVILQELQALRARVAELEGRLDVKPP